MSPAGLLDGGQHLKVQAFPVGRILAVDVADARRQHIDAKLRDLSALSRSAHSPMAT